MAQLQPTVGAEKRYSFGNRSDCGKRLKKPQGDAMRSFKSIFDVPTMALSATEPTDIGIPVTRTVNVGGIEIPDTSDKSTADAFIAAHKRGEFAKTSIKWGDENRPRKGKGKPHPAATVQAVADLLGISDKEAAALISAKPKVRKASKGKRKTGIDAIDRRSASTNGTPVS